MNDWTKQLADFQRSWVEEQQKQVNYWLNGLQGGGTDRQQQTWEHTLDIFEDQMNPVLEAEKRSLKTLAENQEQAEGVPEAYTRWAGELEEGIDLWTDVQQRIWHVWFDMLRNVPPLPAAPGESLARDWQEMARRTLEIQQHWFTDCLGTGAAGSGRGEPVKAASRPAPAGSTASAESEQQAEEQAES